MRKIVTLFLVLQLFLVPSAVFAQGTTGVTAPIAIQSIEGKMAEEQKPKLSVDNKVYYYDPSNYPLIEMGGFITDLIDSQGNTHSFHYNNLTDNWDGTQMELLLLYYSQDAFIKDNILTVEFYKGNGKVLAFEESYQYNMYGYDAAYVPTYALKSTFADQPYLYIRVGLSKKSSEAYSAETTFKVVNPYYKESTFDDRYVVISNESTDMTLYESTGTFNQNQLTQTKKENLKPGAIEEEKIAPFDPNLHKGKLLQKNQISILPAPIVGDTKTFWVKNLSNNTDYQINARLASINSKAEVWVYNNHITDSEAAQLGTEFDNKIHPSVTSLFGTETDIDGDGRIKILCFDVIGAGGYYWGGDTFDISNSNKTDIVYIDTASVVDVAQAYDTVAHEFQHMVNFNRNVLIEKGSNMDSWLNEGLADSASHAYNGIGRSSRIYSYNNSATIANGHSLLYWGDNGDTTSNYALSYLFLQYIKLQANQGDSIFKEILNDSNNNYLAIEKASQKYISPDMTFGKLMTTFRIALLLNKPTGLYGFKGDPFFKSLKDRIYTGNPTSLRGGSSIVMTYNSAEGFKIPADKGAHITYTTFDMYDGPLDETAPLAPKVNEISEQDTMVIGTTEAGAQITLKVGTTVIGSGNADADGNFNVTIPRQKAGSTISVFAKDQTGNESPATNMVVTISFTSIKVQLNGKDFTPGYFGGVSTYVHYKALEIFKIPYTNKGNGDFVIDGRTVKGAQIKGDFYIRWSDLAPGKVIYKTITGGYNFLYSIPIKIQLNGKDFTHGYFKDGAAFVHWKALEVFKIPFVYKGNGNFVIEGREVKAEYINNTIFIRWSDLAPGKVTYKAITDGYNFLFSIPIKIQLNGQDFVKGYFKDGAAYVHWTALQVFKIPHTYNGNGNFVIDGRAVKAEYINGAIFIRWSDLAPGKVTYKTISDGYNFLYSVPIKVQLNGQNFNQGYFKDGTTYVYWKVLDIFQIPYTYNGNGLFTIDGRNVQGETINGALFIRWSQISPGKVAYKTIPGGYNFVYSIPVKAQ